MAWAVPVQICSLHPIAKLPVSAVKAEMLLLLVVLPAVLLLLHLRLSPRSIAGRGAQARRLLQCCL